MGITIPTVHINGSSKQELLEGWSEALKALRVALEKLAQTVPNTYDYYPQGDDAFYKALKEHKDRMVKIQSVMLDLQELCEAIS